jgi:hypothetical protein
MKICTVGVVLFPADGRAMVAFRSLANAPKKLFNVYLGHCPWR